jgi:acyl transferase domain-containing protein
LTRWLFTSETKSIDTSELAKQMAEMKLCQDKYEIGHNEHLKQIIEIQKKYLNIQQIDISNKQRGQERVNKELGQLKDSMHLLKLQQTEEFKKNQTLFATKFEQVKTELKNNNQQVSELKNQQKQLLQQLQNQKKKPKKEALESKIDNLNGDFKEQKQAFNRCDLHITSVCSEIQNSIKNLTKQQGFLQNLVLDLKSAMKEQVQTEEDSSDKGYSSVASQNESLPQLASIFKFDEDYIGGCYEKKVVNFMYEESYDEAELSDSDF